MSPGDLLGLLIVVLMPTLLLIYLARRFFSLRERQLELQAGQTAEKAAQYATSNAQLEQRMRVLEQIVTDRGVDTAAQIEALRPPRLSAQSNVK